MGRENYENPFVAHSATGNLANDLEKTIVDERERLEKKKEAYELTTQFLGDSVHLLAHNLDERIHNPNVEVVPDDILMRADPMAMQTTEQPLTSEDVLSLMFMNHIMTKTVYDLIDERHSDPSIARAGQFLAEANHVVQPIISNDQAVNYFRTRVGQGALTGVAAMSSFWKMIKENLPEGADFYVVAGSERSLKTLAQIASAWEMNELDERMVALGAEIEEGRKLPVVKPIIDMKPEFFVFNEDGVRIDPDHLSDFITNDPARKFGCPVAHSTVAEDAQGEVGRIIPIKEYAKLFLSRAKVLETLS